MRQVLIAFSAALLFVAPAHAQTRVRADPSALDPPIVRTPPSTGMGLSEPRYRAAVRPAPFRNYNNPRVEYGSAIRNFGARR
jgi:hypothetical protein